jgi:hypothetical protein
VRPETPVVHSTQPERQKLEIGPNLKAFPRTKNILCKYNEERNYRMIEYSNEILEYERANSRGRTRKCSPQPKMQISATKKSCKKITISQDIIAELHRPETVEVGFTNFGIVFGSHLAKGSKSKNYFVIRQVGSCNVIYSTPLVREINRRFQIKYSKKGSSIFNDIVYHKENGRRIVHIILVKEEGA